MSYDEQVTPESDPPLVEPPPPVARLSGILAQSPGPRTEVVAALRPAERDESGVPPQTDTVPSPAEPEPAVPDLPPVVPDPAPVLADPEPLIPVPEPVVPDPDPVVPDPVVPDPEPEPEPDPDPEPEPEPDPDPEPEPVVDDGLVERWCEMCGARVRVGPDDAHCAFRHKLSPAHAKPKRRWWQRA
jgi:hypothetical protein